ncbi:hypothetical protein [Thalassococcus sp. S3]|uniref:hypothetical protein n=1 Tax=Thalassococcus sp. S3 TaxID=2017482 RepID=UPI0013EED882|nr:hypothetical protein [Thalassococcus sp. S3]
MKTGSTSIQQALASQAWRCPSQTLDYVVAPENPYHHSLAMAFALEDTEAIDAEMQALSERIAQSTADVVVMSSELFEEVPPERFQAAIRRYLPQYEPLIQFLIYTRPHASRYLSSYSQVIKLGYFLGTLTDYFEDALEDRRFFHADRYMRWRAVFGDAVTVRAMLRPELFQQDVVQDFFHIAFDGAGFQVVDLPQTNESLALSDMAVLRDFHQRLKINHRWGQKAMLTARMRVGERLSEFLMRTPPVAGSTRLALHRELMDRIEETYGPDAVALDDAFFEGRPLFQTAMEQASQAAVDEEQSLDILDYFAPGILQQTQFWADLIGDLIKRDPQHWDLFFLEILNREMRGLSQADSV